MDKLFFFVTNSDAWKNYRDFHENFFVTHKAFLYGFLLALIVALLLAVIYYFGCCNSKRENKLATVPTWCGFLVATALITFLVANFVFIGKSSTTETSSIFYKNSFYNANKQFVVDKTKGNPAEQIVAKYTKDKTQIDKNLDSGKDVRYPYSIGCAVYSLLFFYLLSLLFKGFTYQGVAIPHQWPHKS